MDNPLAIGVDLGGTKIAFCLIDRQGNVLAAHQVATGVNEGDQAVLDRMADGIRTVLVQASAGNVLGIGIGSPGQVDPTAGTVSNAVNLNWEVVLLRAGLQKRLGTNLPIFLQKDTNATLLGELYYGAARNCRDVVLVAVGTGLGVGVITSGQIVVGARHDATDIGHLAIDPQGRLCACGQRGCTEMYVSGVGLLAGIREHCNAYPESPLAQQDAVSPSTADILSAARAGDPLAQIVLDEAADWLGLIFMYCGVILNPAMFILGGGLGLAAADLLLERAKRVFRARSSLRIHEGVDFRLAQLTSNAIGGACLVWHELGLSSAKINV